MIGRRSWRTPLLVLAAAALAPDTCWAAAEAVDAETLSDMSLEELLSQQVTSAGKKPQRLSDTASAVYVINQEQIARSGARNLSDLLRMVPGFEVSEAQASAVAVSSRGFASRFVANLLVTVDGAAIYGSSLAGIFWDQANFPLQDIERIEVIRGPGGSLWGNNSVNGVVNIITRQGIDTRGVRADVQYGIDSSRAEGGVGVTLSDTVYAHAYATHRRSDARSKVNDRKFDLMQKATLAGLRIDATPTADDTIVALAEYGRGHFDDLLSTYVLQGDLPVQNVTMQHNHADTRHILARWTHTFSPELDLTVQGYYNSLSRTEWNSVIKRRLYDLSVEGRWQASARHELNFGVSGRISDELGNSSIGVSAGIDHWLTGYVQDEFAIVPDTVTLTIGSKFELNDFGASNLQPSVRGHVRLDKNTSAWAAVTRAVRTPLLSARAATFGAGSYLAPTPERTGGYLYTNYEGNPDATSEKLTSYEAGIRGKIADGWSFDLAAFYARYSHLATIEALRVVPILSPTTSLPIGATVTTRIGNGAKANSKGFEALVSGSPVPGWQVEASYAFLDLSQVLVTSTRFATPLVDSARSARHQVRLRNTIELTPDLQLSTFTHYVSASPAGLRGAYTKQDLRLSWSPSPKIELSLVGVDLLNRERLEYRQEERDPLAQTYVRRSAYVEARVRL